MFNDRKNKQSKILGIEPTKFSFLLVCILACISISMPSLSTEIRTKSYPLAFHVDLCYCLPTSIYIKCDVKEYNISFSDFSSMKKDMRESKFTEVVMAIHSNDVEKCLNMVLRKSDMNAVETQKFNQKIPLWVSSWGSGCLGENIAGKNLEKLKVISQFYLGNCGVFVYGADSGFTPGSGPFRAAFSFVTRPDGTPLWKVENPDAIESLVMVTSEQMAIAPAGYVAVEGGNLGYAVPIPDTNNTEHVVYLMFNGDRYDVNVLSDTLSSVEKPTSSVVAFFQKYYLMAKAGCTPESLAELYTDDSRERYLEWIKDPKLTSLVQWHFKNWANTERKVRFVIDANPLYIVLYQIRNVNGLAHSFVLRDTKDGKLKFANFHCSGFLDDLFNNQKFITQLSELVVANETGQNAKN